MSINDSDSKAKKAAEPTDTKPTSKPGVEPDLLADVEHLDRDLELERKRAEEAAHEREMMTNLTRAAAAAELLMAARSERIPEDEHTEPHGEDEPDTARTEPPHVPSLALRSDGKTLLHVAHLDVIPANRELWTGVVLSHAEACNVLARLSNACDEAAGYVAGNILYGSKRKDEDEDGSGSEA